MEEWLVFTRVRGCQESSALSSKLIVSEDYIK